MRTMSIERILAGQIPYQRVEAQPGVYRIFIRDLVLSSSIGVYDWEKLAPQRVRINVDVTAREPGAALSDDIGKVVSYDDLVKGIKAIALEGHINLVETLAERVASLCMSDPRVVIVRVSRTARGPQVIVSRTDPSLLARLFEMEVPEIYEGTVLVKNAVREPGDRAKVAVFSKDKDVDPVGACVGIKGARVQNIIRELRGEKIDIVEWSDDAKTFAINALNPAKVSRVAIVDEKEKVMEVIVEDKQLSLAIGKRGQNVRLAARLLGWRIDIKSEEEKKREVQSQMDAAMATAETDVRVLEGIGEKTLKKLIAHGVTSLEKIVASPAAVVEVPGVGEKTAEKIVRLAREHLGLETADSEPAAADESEGDDGEEEALLVGEGASGVEGGADRGEGSDGTGGER